MIKQTQTATDFNGHYDPEDSLSGTMESLSSSPAWARGLSCLFAWPLRLALSIASMDFVAAAIGQLVAFIFCKKIIGVAGAINDYFPLWLIYNILLILLISLQGGYSKIRGRRSEEELRIVTIGNILAIFILIAINFILTEHKVAFSRLIFISGFLFSLILTLVVHFSFRSLMELLWGYGLAKENLLIVGDSLKDIRWFLNQLLIQRYHGFNILGYVAETASASVADGLVYLGNFQELEKIHTNKPVDKVLFAMQGYTNKRHQLLSERLEICGKFKIQALVLSHIINDYHFELSLDGYSGIFALSSRDPAYTRPFFWFSKRCFDFIFSLVIILAAFPLWLTVIIRIKLFDRGPIFYRSRRIGKGGVQFDALKFRTMVVNADEILKSDRNLLEEFQKNIKLDSDPRVTAVGRWLRKYSLDELPQFINVLKGDMSLVGPRPALPGEIDLIGEFIKERNLIRPGLTGFWQVSGRSETSYEERVQMDRFYMRKVSIWMDLLILIKTPLIVINGHGAV